MVRPKDKGTSWESAIVTYLRDGGFPDVERRALKGVLDRGDIAGLRGIMIEAKNVARVSLSTILAEVKIERANAAAWLGVAWIKKIGKTSPGEGYVVMSGEQFLELLRKIEPWEERP